MTSTIFVLASAILLGAGQQGKAAGDAADVRALEQKIEAAVVRGDVAFVSSVLSDDFHFVHGDGWTTGGKALMEDDKTTFLKRVADREYAVHDLDSVKVEMHGDVAITYGRYVSLFVPKNRSGNSGQLNSIWFERVYAKRDGRWMFLSHRTVHGPTVSPAGVDPTAAR
jgi:ketosteroid isomerase-like protein